MDLINNSDEKSNEFRAPNHSPLANIVHEDEESP